MVCSPLSPQGLIFMLCMSGRVWWVGVVCRGGRDCVAGRGPGVWGHGHGSWAGGRRLRVSLSLSLSFPPRAAKASPSAVPSVPRLSPARRSLQALPLLLRCRPAGRLLHAHGQRAGRQPVDPVTPRTRTRVMSPGPRGLQSVACFFGNLHIDEGPCLESYFSEVVPSSPWYFLWSPAPTSSRCLRPLPASHAARLAPLPW